MPAVWAFQIFVVNADRCHGHPSVMACAAAHFIHAMRIVIVNQKNLALQRIASPSPALPCPAVPRRVTIRFSRHQKTLHCSASQRRATPCVAGPRPAEITILPGASQTSKNLALHCSAVPSSAMHRPAKPRRAAPLSDNQCLRAAVHNATAQGIKSPILRCRHQISFTSGRSVPFSAFAQILRRNPFGRSLFLGVPHTPVTQTSIPNLLPCRCHTHSLEKGERGGPYDIRG